MTALPGAVLSAALAPPTLSLKQTQFKFKLCDFRQVAFYASVYSAAEGDQDIPSRNMPLWHKVYFELKAIKKQQMQGKLFILPLSA